MRNRWLGLVFKLGGALLLVTLSLAVPGLAAAHTAACHTDRTCPSDVTPPDYVCGDNPTTTCSAPNAPDTTQANAAPSLGGPPSADDCRNYEIFYNGSICKQVLGVTAPSPAVSGLPGSSALPIASAAPTAIPTFPATASVPDFSLPPGVNTEDGLAAAALVAWAGALAASVFMVAALWRVFTKAGEPGWAALVPVYNTVVYLKLVRRPWWWIFILWLVVPLFIVNSELAKSFGRSSGFSIGLTLLPFVFLPILGFGPARYRRSDGGGPRPLPL